VVHFSSAAVGNFHSALDSQSESMTWNERGPVGTTFQIAAVVMVVRERAGHKQNRPAGEVLGGPGTRRRLMLLVQIETRQRPLIPYVESSIGESRVGSYSRRQQLSP
jgi:hypothetical protein